MPGHDHGAGSLPAFDQPFFENDDIQSVFFFRHLVR
jgi:hypothetical protein